MGKNQGHKQLQRTRHTGAEGAPELDAGDGLADVSFHSPEWHAARIAALTTERMSWEDWKKKQKEDAAIAAAEGENEEKLMREYRAQLDADRASRLAKGSNNAHLREALVESKDKKSKRRRRKDEKEKKRKKKGKDKEKDRDKKQRRSKDSKKSKKRKRSSDSSSDGTSSGSSSSDDDQPAQKKGASSSGPVRLSEFLQSGPHS
ncbi:hypothetical protein WJX72_002680 [[Myrmecia] bisecta]|uniref:Uncharacterized protein n=1 Tax=[Myrmecia] bisecta TaxID=41462 RepID=A0AAW1R6G6_9CHLO